MRGAFDAHVFSLFVLSRENARVPKLEENNEKSAGKCEKFIFFYCSIKIEAGYHEIVFIFNPKESNRKMIFFHLNSGSSIDCFECDSTRAVWFRTLNYFEWPVFLRPPGLFIAQGAESLKARGKKKGKRTAALYSDAATFFLYFSFFFVRLAFTFWHLALENHLTFISG